MIQVQLVKEPVEESSIESYLLLVQYNGKQEQEHEKLYMQGQSIEIIDISIISMGQTCVVECSYMD